MTLESGKVYTVVVAVDVANIGCGVNDPTVVAWQRWSVNVVGDEKGQSLPAVIG